MSRSSSAITLAGATFASLAILTTAPARAGALRFVDDDAPPGGNGMSWATAYNDLQDAFDDAADAVLGVTEIRIAGGTYRPDRGTADPAMFFSFSSGVSYLGGFAGFGASDPDARDLETNPTILSADLLGDDQPDDYYDTFRVDNSELLVWESNDLSATTVIDGLTFRGRGTTYYPVNFARGAPKFTRCRFDDGGTLMLWGCDSVVEDCTFGPNPMSSGAAMQVLTSATDPTPEVPATVRDCRFTDCHGWQGGAVEVESNGHVEFERCTFENNGRYIPDAFGTVAVYTDNGGAIYARGDSHVSVTDSQFIGNGCFEAGGAITMAGVTDLTIVGCRFEGNATESDGPGGAIGSDWFGTLPHAGHCRISDSTFIGNQGRATNTPFGGAIMVDGPSLTVTNSRFLGNLAANFYATISGRGGAVWFRGPKEAVGTFINCEFSGNHAEALAGAIYSEVSTLSVINSTISGNSAKTTGGVVGNAVITIDNSILWGNADDAGTIESSQVSLGGASVPALNYSCIQGLTGAIPGIGNIGLDPLFIDPDGADNTLGTEDDDLQLGSGSSCIDAGDNMLVPAGITTDLAGNPRFAGGVVDMGAREAPAPACAADCHAGGDDVVDVVDLLALLAAWGQTGSPCDSDGDGIIGVFDLLTLLSAWGGCP